MDCSPSGSSSSFRGTRQQPLQPLQPCDSAASALARTAAALAAVIASTTVVAKLSIASGAPKQATAATGTVAPGFELVKLVFEEHLRTGAEEHAQCAAYLNGEKVVDLHGSAAVSSTSTGGAYDETSTQNVFSTTKAVTSLVVALLEDRGHLKYDQLVEEIYPEYAQNGKAGTTIAQVMRHEAGLANFNLAASDLTTERIKAGATSAKIAELRPRFPNGSRDVADRYANPEQSGWRAYHATTRGWIINEIVRRADPEGRTIGEILKDEIVAPLGLLDELFIGSPTDAQLASIEDLSFYSNWRTWRSIVVPNYLGGAAVPLKSGWLKAMLVFGIPAYEIACSLGIDLPGLGGIDLEPEPDGSIPEGVVATFNSLQVRMVEVPSANGHGSARALAKLAATIVEGGELNGVRLMSKEGAERAQAGGVLDSMGIGGRFTSGDLNEENVFTNAGVSTQSDLVPQSDSAVIAEKMLVVSVEHVRRGES